MDVYEHRPLKGFHRIEFYGGSMPKDNSSDAGRDERGISRGCSPLSE